MLRLAEIPNIAAVKEASGNLGQIMDIIRDAPGDFRVLCGDDAMALAVVLLGGDGIVSRQSIKSFADLQDIVGKELQADRNQHATVPVLLQVRHAGSTQLVTTTVNVREHPPSGQGPMGIQASGKVIFDRLPLWQAPIRGVLKLAGPGAPGRAAVAVRDVHRLPREAAMTAEVPPFGP